MSQNTNGRVRLALTPGMAHDARLDGKRRRLDSRVCRDEWRMSQHSAKSSRNDPIRFSLLLLIEAIGVHGPNCVGR